MTRKTRDILFWVCVILFALIGPPLVLYARGYRFDIARKKFVATGGLFIKSGPSGAFIYVNGVKRGETSGALRDAIAKPGLITNLLPKEYDVRVEKRGYVPWTKKLTVLPRQITEARSVLLFADPNKPQTPLRDAVAGTALVAPEGNGILAVFEQGATTTIASVNVSGIRKVSYAVLRGKSQKQHPLFTLHDTSPTGNLVLTVETMGEKEELLRVIDRKTRTAAMATHRTEPTQRSVFFDDATVLFLTKKHELRAWSLASDTATSLGASVWGVSMESSRAYVVAGTPPLIYAYTNNPVRREQVAPTPLEIQPGTVTLQAHTLNHGRLAVLAIPEGENGGPALIVENDGSMKTLHEKALDMRISPDGKKILLRTWNELWTYYLEDVLTQPPHRKGDMVLVARFGNTLRDARWHPLSGEHILYVTSEGLFVIELDNRGSGRTTLDLVRNGSIELIDTTHDGIWFAAQKFLSFLPWEPKQK